MGSYTTQLQARIAHWEGRVAHLKHENEKLQMLLDRQADEENEHLHRLLDAVKEVEQNWPYGTIVKSISNLLETYYNLPEELRNGPLAT